MQRVRKVRCPQICQPQILPPSANVLPRVLCSDFSMLWCVCLRVKVRFLQVARVSVGVNCLHMILFMIYDFINVCQNVSTCKMLHECSDAI